MNYKGKLIITCGPMFSCKSTSLFLAYQKYNIAGKKCIVVKYAKDTRYDKTNKVVSHNGYAVEGITANELVSVDEAIQKFDVILIDEIQFFKDAGIYCDKWANQGKIVEVYGLVGTYERKMWPVMVDLFPKADNIIFMTAICKETGEDAPFTKRTIDVKGDEFVGGAESYEAVDRPTFFS